jgi:hypothetical protein
VLNAIALDENRLAREHFACAHVDQAARLDEDDIGFGIRQQHKEVSHIEL